MARRLSKLKIYISKVEQLDKKVVNDGGWVLWWRSENKAAPWVAFPTAVAAMGTHDECASRADSMGGDKLVTITNDPWVKEDKTTRHFWYCLPKGTAPLQHN